MGDITEGIVDGEICQSCFMYIRGEAPGHPRNCSGCEREAHDAQHHAGLVNHRKVACPSCGKKVKEVGLADHTRVVHGANHETHPCPTL